MMRQKKNLMDINIDALYNILKKNQGDVNDAMGLKKKTVVVTSDPLALVAKKTKITALLAKAFNQRKFYSKPTNNNLRTSSASQSANKKQEFVKSDDKKVEKKDDEKKQDMRKVKYYNCKKEGHFTKDCKKAKVKDYEYYKSKMLLANKDKDEQVLLAEDHAWMESSSDSNQEINANKVFIAQIEKVLLDLEASSSSTNDKISETVHMILPSKDKMYNVRKGIGFENPSYLCKAKDLRPTLYDDRVINLGYTLMFLTQSDEALKNEKFKRARENKIEFSYDYGNLNASYVNEKINFFEDYFKEIINPDFEKIDSSFQQTSSLKSNVPTVILEKIIIDLEDEVVSLMEKEKENLKTIESLKLKDVETDLETLSSVRRPKLSGVMWMRNGLSNTIKADFSYVNHSNLNKNVKRCSRKNMMACNNSDTRSAFDCNNAINALCNARMNASIDANDLFVFYDNYAYMASEIATVAEPVAKWIPRVTHQIDKISKTPNSSGCSNHMTGNRALLTNFVEKLLGTVRFGNNNFTMIAGYEDVVIESMTIKKFYYVEGLGHTLFSVGQFCDKGLEVAFRKSTCFVRNEDGVDLLTGDCSSNFYTISLNEVASNSSTCLLAKVSSSESWLWHQRLSHLNFSTINNLVKNNLVHGLPKMKFKKDHLCFACEQRKIHRKHHKSKTALALNKPLYLLHMALCGPMRVKSINGKYNTPCFWVIDIVNNVTMYLSYFTRLL
nr:retrovirus-related Pol polyprotein from transposon TNT 1-94 [Tanacetum cinerariifolium]